MAEHPPVAVFGRAYADPVVLVNGTPMTLVQLIDWARSLQRAFDRLTMTVLDHVETADRVVLAFEMRGRHVGTYRSPPDDHPIVVRWIRAQSGTTAGTLRVPQVIGTAVDRGRLQWAADFDRGDPGPGGHDRGAEPGNA
jgi:hypothetical protein